MPNRFARMTKIKSKINKNGIGKTIGIKLSPWELSMYIAGMDIINGINSLIIFIVKYLILYCFKIILYHFFFTQNSKNSNQFILE